MASRVRSFLRLENIFHLKNVKNDLGLARKSNVFFSTTTKSGKFPTTFMVIGSLGIGGGLYGYLTTPDRKGRKDSVPYNEKFDYIVDYEIPDLKPSRTMPGPATDLGLEFTLYQYQNCPFCCKVRAFLDFYGIPYNVIEVNPVMRQQLKFSDYKKVPILVVKDKKTSVKYQLNDSSLIISILGTLLLDTEEKLENVLKYYMPYEFTSDCGKKKKEVLNTYFLMFGEKQSNKKDESITKERNWRKWADSDLVHILSPNIYRTYDEALQAFNYFSEVGEWDKNFAAWERTYVIYVGAIAMYFIGKRLKKKYRLKEDVREFLYDACQQWMKAIGPKQTFMGGDVPNLADLAVYGLLNSIEGCLAFQDLLKRTNIRAWYYSVKEAVSNHTGYKMIQ